MSGPSDAEVAKVAAIIKTWFTEEWHDDSGHRWKEDVLLTGCKKVGNGRGYQNAEQAADNLRRDLAKALLTALASPTSSEGKLRDTLDLSVIAEAVHAGRFVQGGLPYRPLAESGSDDIAYVFRIANSVRSALSPNKPLDEEKMRESDWKEQHLLQWPDMGVRLERAFALLVEKSEHYSVDGRLTGCTSYIQRKLQCGYNAAAKDLNEMVALGWITEPDDTGARRITRSALSPNKPSPDDGREGR